MQINTFNFFYAKRLVCWLVAKEAHLKETGMSTTGYYSELPLHNLGSVFVLLILLPVLHLTLTTTSCIGSKICCYGEPRQVPKIYINLIRNVNLKTYLNVLLGYQTVIVCCALLYLWHAEEYTFTVIEEVRIKAKKRK